MRLRECLRLRRKINDLEMRISEVRTVFLSPKVQLLTFTPSSSSGGFNTFERFLIKLDELEEKRLYLEKEINEIWDFAETELHEKEIKSKHIMLLKLRFYYGLSWWKCCEKMRKLFPSEKWTEAKIYKIYSNITKEIEIL
jgi:hypothetical protein